MDQPRFNPNHRLRIAKPASALVLGAVCLFGCADNQTRPQQSQAETAPLTTELITDNNCVVTGNGGGLMSNTEKTVRAFAEDYVQDMGQAAQTDLSSCVDEVIDTMTHTPENIRIGAGSPDSLTDTVFVPANVAPRHNG